uniref:Uncharacterized protein n=1 Tax=Tortanus dextrilobatus TaxID=207953 RepID=A0A0U2IGL0_9MAXI|nr:hypothetical protein [Tortanus dextrilobatus]ALS05235.1 hypothetical protein [Tortanus dextrilobatus]
MNFNVSFELCGFPLDGNIEEISRNVVVWCLEDLTIIDLVQEILPLTNERVFSEYRSLVFKGTCYLQNAEPDKKYTVHRETKYYHNNDSYIIILKLNMKPYIRSPAKKDDPHQKFQFGRTGLSEKDMVERD